MDTTSLHDLQLWRTKPDYYDMLVASPNGRSFASCRNPWVYIFDGDEEKPRLTCQGHTRSVRGLAYSPDGRCLASAAEDELIVLWDSETGAKLAELTGRRGLGGVAFAPGGRVLASIGTDGVRLWDAASHELLGLLPFPVRGFSSPQFVKFTQDGKKMVASAGGSVRVWDVAQLAGIVAAASTRPPLLPGEGGVQVLGPCPSEVRCLAFSPDGQLLASGHGNDAKSNDSKPRDDASVRIWDMRTGKELRCMTGFCGPVNSVAFLPDNKRLLVADGGTGAVDHLRIFDVTTGQEVRRLSSIGIGIKSAAVAAAGRRAVAVAGDGALHIWGLDDGKECGRHEDGGSLTNLAVSPDGHRVLTSGDGIVRLWDIETGKVLVRLKGHIQLLRAVAFSPDGRQAVSGSVGAACHWDLDEGRQVTRIGGLNTLPVSGLAYSPDGRYLVMCGGTEPIRLWDTHHWRPLRGFSGHEKEVLTVIFSPDGRRIASGGKDNAIRLWGSTPEKK